MKFVACSTLTKDKFLCYGASSETDLEDTLQILRIEKVSNVMGGFDKRALKAKLDHYSSQGSIVVVEERIPFLADQVTALQLNDNYIDPGRLNRDWAFDQFQALYHSQELILPQEIEYVIPKPHSFEIKEEESGKAIYVFRNAIKPQFRVILLLVASFCFRPLDEVWLQEYDPEPESFEDPLRTFHRVTTQLDIEACQATID